MSRTLSPVLTPEQQAESDRIDNALIAAAGDDIRTLANQMASRTDQNLLGDNEFTLCDIILRIAAKGLEIALEGRKKGGTKGPAAPVSTAANRPVSNAGRRKPS